MFRDLYRQRQVLTQLAVYDFKHDYLGTWFGVLWAFIHPLLSAIILWFIFAHGFRVQMHTAENYFLWLLAGLFPWQFAALCMKGGALSVVQNSFLIRKLKFRVEFLPIVKLISASFLHAFFLVILIGVAVYYGVQIRPNLLQLLYFWFASAILMLGFAWLVSALTVFVRDLAGFVEVMIQVGFLATPIFWHEGILPDGAGWILKLNPMYYIVSGYRESLFGNGWFFERPAEMAIYWAFSIIFCAIGAFAFNKLKTVFADFI